MNIISLIASNSFITVNKPLAKAFGIETALMLGELASECEYWKSQDQLIDGYFYSTIENVENNTTLSGHIQRIALNKLKALGIVDCQVKGMPAKRYIKINEDQVVKIFNNKLLNSLTTSSEEFEQQVVQEFNTNNNNINNNKNNNKEECEPPNTGQTIFDYYVEHIGIITPMVYNGIEEWLKVVDSSLIKYAIDEAVRCEKKNWAYVRTIIKAKYENGRCYGSTELPNEVKKPKPQTNRKRTINIDTINRVMELGS